jgi:hypothetical protein
VTNPSFRQQLETLALQGTAALLPQRRNGEGTEREGGWVSI